MTALTGTQRAFMARLKGKSNGERSPNVGGRLAGAVASGWHRTAKSLQDKGLVFLRREGDGVRATLAHICAGDTVRLGDGTMTGTVTQILHEAWSNGGVPMAVVEWDSGSTSRETVTKLLDVHPTDSLEVSNA